MKRSEINRTTKMPTPDNLKLVQQSCKVENNGRLNFRWAWNNGYVKQFFVDLEIIEKNRNWVEMYSEGLMK